MIDLPIIPRNLAPLLQYSRADKVTLHAPAFQLENNFPPSLTASVQRERYASSLRFASDLIMRNTAASLLLANYAKSMP